MSRPDDADFRDWRFETFEERLALSIQPVAEFWYESAEQSVIEPSSALMQPLVSSEGHGWTELAAARDQHGLRGYGQTVAIIDSGIAYDHVAFGGGLGSSYKVVGGWDFAESDANPYDDAPAGFHGTHVAGIVGAQDSRYPGVAPSVDLVALRVFNDQGGGYFQWVEQALTWVHAHRNDYEFPITTVNLSLGTEWNATSLPKWATLEDELKQLAADGIFVSVAAGNSFLTYNAVGLSYPAVSPHVTPVASVDGSASLSRFSQRSDRVLAAPGEKVTSTLPDAFYGGDGVKNDWGAASGTSMAAPYVAGASVLVREAMQNRGDSQITPASIAELFHRTADKVFDPITNASYDRINVARALSSLVGSPVRSPVTINGTLATITGTSGNDSIRWDAGRQQITFNGAAYWLAGVTQITIDAGGGNDSLLLVGGSGAESVVLRPGQAELTGPGYSLSARGAENIQFHGDRRDRATLHDSAGRDRLEATPQWARLSGSGYENYVSGVGSITVNATSGSGDFAHLVGSETSDVLGVWRNQRNLYAGGAVIHTIDFPQVRFDGGGGHDIVDYYSSSKNGFLYGRSHYGSVIDQAFETQFNGVELVQARLRSTHRLKADLAALEFVFQKYGRK